MTFVLVTSVTFHWVNRKVNKVSDKIFINANFTEIHRQKKNEG